LGLPPPRSCPAPGRRLTADSRPTSRRRVWQRHASRLRFTELEFGDRSGSGLADTRRYGVARSGLTVWPRRSPLRRCVRFRAHRVAAAARLSGYRVAAATHDDACRSWCTSAWVYSAALGRSR
jgi:hypothetical protein